MNDPVARLTANRATGPTAVAEALARRRRAAVLVARDASLPGARRVAGCVDPEGRAGRLRSYQAV